MPDPLVPMYRVTLACSPAGAPVWLPREVGWEELVEIIRTLHVDQTILIESLTPGLQPALEKPGPGGK